MGWTRGSLSISSTKRIPPGFAVVAAHRVANDGHMQAVRYRPANRADLGRVSVSRQFLNIEVAEHTATSHATL